MSVVSPGMARTGEISFRLPGANFNILTSNSIITNMSLPREQAWFAAKRYGYGWGFPKRWQGWVVFLGYLLAVVVPAFFLTTPGRTVGYLVYVILLSLALVAVCVERPDLRRMACCIESVGSRQIGWPRTHR